jgi:hypothetical protein
MCRPSAIGRDHLGVGVVLRSGPALGADTLLETGERQLGDGRVRHGEHADVDRLGRLGGGVDAGLLPGRQRHALLGPGQDVVPVLAQPRHLGAGGLEPPGEPRCLALGHRDDLGAGGLELLGLGLAEEAGEQAADARLLLALAGDDDLLAAAVGLGGSSAGLGVGRQGSKKERQQGDGRQRH